MTWEGVQTEGEECSCLLFQCVQLSLVWQLRGRIQPGRENGKRGCDIMIYNRFLFSLLLAHVGLDTRGNALAKFTGTAS